MAKKPAPKPSGPVYISVVGPTQPVIGSTPNPADAIRFGALPVKMTPDQTVRRAFQFPTKPSLHRNEGLSMDEFNQPRHEDSVGENKQPYSHGSNVSVTGEGEPVRGS